MYTIAILFFVCFTLGMPWAFADYFECVERYEFVQPLQVPENMVFWQEHEDFGFWPEVKDENAYVRSNLHFALVHFWNEMPKNDLTVAPERISFPAHIESVPSLLYTSPDRNYGWGINAAHFAERNERMFDNETFNWMKSYFA